ncbi:MAG: iron-sulfur cluster assembly accessory protein [Pseudomonadales bacterium]|nr:iron-sulfur cluster assembly accessory protein [Pseudomonadales bacterium]MCP5358303.1 iron-sulfur cluster assembly accessory protein [Pseudomonadales bacterium]
MSVESFDPVQSANEGTVEVTAAAVAHFRSQLQKNATARAIRLSVKQSGCTGYMYVVDLVPEARPDDLHLALEEGVELLVDRGSVPIVKGTRIDYVTEGVNRQLQFLNPNAKDHCGCGESFNVN